MSYAMRQVQYYYEISAYVARAVTSVCCYLTVVEPRYYTYDRIRIKNSHPLMSSLLSLNCLHSDSVMDSACVARLNREMMG